MKATGIVRRIDELGRVVIPKEIRRTLRIREGDPLEIFTDREDTEKVFADRGAGGFCEGIRGIAAAGAWDDGGRVRQGHGDSRERAMPQGADR